MLGNTLISMQNLMILNMLMFSEMPNFTYV
jgi:hypothetical protein